MKYNQPGVQREKAQSLTLLWLGLHCVMHLSFLELEVQKWPYFKLSK